MPHPIRPALGDVLAVYSSHPSAPLALAARSAALDAGAFRALAAAGVRLPAMRGSIHLMPAVAGARAFRALPESAAAGRARLKGFGIEPARYTELRANGLRYRACELPQEGRDGALAWLAGEYLQTLGPARREDVIWWLGVTLGHAPDGRQRCAMRPECFDFRGDGLPVVLVDGRAVGTWSLTAKGSRLAFAFAPFDGAPSRRVRTAVDARAEELARLLG